MFFKRLFGKSRPTQEFVYIGEQKEFAKHKNPLPDLFPHAYKEKVSDEYALLDKMLSTYEPLVADLIYACHHRREGIVERFMNNFRAVLEIPMIYSFYQTLGKKQRAQELENAFAVGTLLQLCLLYGDSSRLERLREDLMLVLAGLFLRRYGSTFLTREEREILSRSHHWDLTEARQKALRDQFLKQYRSVADKIARISTERVAEELTAKSKCTPEKLKAFLHIIRFSWRIKGRTAAKLTEKERDSVHTLSGYCSIVNAIASAWVGHRKRLTLILAEEWGRMRVAFQSNQVTVGGSGSAVAMEALGDLFDVTHCLVLTNFQGSGRDAVYCPVTKVLARELHVVAELKDGSDKSIRRYVRKNKEGKEEIVEEEVRTITQLRWQLFRLPERINIPHRHLMEYVYDKRGTSEDPTDEELIPMDQNEA